MATLKLDLFVLQPNLSRREEATASTSEKAESIAITKEIMALIQSEMQKEPLTPKQVGKMIKKAKYDSISR